MTSRMLTAQEAAREMRCHEKTVRRMIGRGEIRGSIVAGKWLINEDDLPTRMPARRPGPGRRPGQAGDAVALARRITAAERSAR